jgi:hypothetical protein
MPVTSDIYTVPARERPISFRLETQAYQGMTEELQKECTYVCDECSCLFATFVGIPGQTPIPADVLESMTEHARSHY